MTHRSHDPRERPLGSARAAASLTRAIAAALLLLLLLCALPLQTSAFSGPLRLPVGNSGSSGGSDDANADNQAVMGA